MNHPITSALIEIIKTKRKFCIIQIGAYVGNDKNDPLYNILINNVNDYHEPKIVLVEPIKQYFEMLKSNYRSVPGVSFENVVISQNEGISEMYYLPVDARDYGYPDWLNQLSSLKENRMTTIWKNYENIKEYQDFYLGKRQKQLVESIKLETLISRYQIENIDLLQIDAEGMDYIILKEIPKLNFKPRFINYENVLLFEKKQECEILLRDLSYELTDYGQDTFCRLII